MKPLRVFLFSGLLFVAAGRSAAVEPIIVEPVFDVEAFACFYECEPAGREGQSRDRWKEIATLMLGNGEPTTDADAFILFFDGRQQPILDTMTLLEARDLDEVNLCRTLQKAADNDALFGNGEVPEAGLIEVLVASLAPQDVIVPAGQAASLAAVAPPTVQSGPLWNLVIRNKAGNFRRGHDEPKKTKKLEGTGKTQCRPKPVETTQELNDRLVPDMPRAPIKTDPVIIADTDDFGVGQPMPGVMCHCICSGTNQIGGGDLVASKESCQALYCPRFCRETSGFIALCWGDPCSGIGMK